MSPAFRTEVLLCIGVGLLLSVLLRALRPAQRRTVSHVLMLLVACALAEGIAISATALSAARTADIAHHAATLLAGVSMVRLGMLMLFHLLLPAMGVRVVRIVEDLCGLGVMVFWGLVWLGMVGVNLASLITTSAVITAVIAFAMQDTLGNILGGIVLQLDGSVRWRFTAIETRNRETVYVPNSLLMKNRFMVMGSRSDPEMRWRRWVWFSVEAAAPPTRVCEVLQRAVIDAEIPLVARDPEPSAVLMDVTEGCGRYALRYWLCDAREDDPTDSRVRAHALAGLERAGIRTSTRREERIVLAEDAARREILAGEEQLRRLRALSRVPLFATLSDEEKQIVSAHLVHAPFLAGDVVTRKGAVAHWLYLVINGEAEIVDELNGKRSRVATMGAGDIFGERGMLTGEPRSATVCAVTDLECYRLDKAGFQGVIQARPDIAQELSRVLVTRAAELDALRRDAAVTAVPQANHLDLLARIRSFFGLG
jgi:CRP-like cAMP-binding protein/small-conductance mechanosensitive channel